MKEYMHWFPQVFLRAPLYSFKDFSREKLDVVVQNPLFQDALYLASPVFYEIIERKNFDISQLSSKEINGLLKYFNRMCFRPTPFGAFASFTLVPWGDYERIDLAGIDQAILHLLPSQEIIMRLFGRMNRPSSGDLLVLNPTAYRSGKSIRYVHGRADSSGKFNFFLTAIAAEELNAVLFKWLSQTSHTLLELQNKIIAETDCSPTEAQAYIDFLIDEQFLYDKRQGSIFESGGLKETLFGFVENFQSPQKIGAAWPKPEHLLPSPSVGLAKSARAWIAAFPKDITMPEKGIYYGALERPLVHGGLPLTDQLALEEALGALDCLVPHSRLPALEEFKSAFKARFDQERAPLLQALDPDSGISFGEVSDSGLSAGWLKDVEFPRFGNSTDRVEWTAVHRLFLKKWVGNLQRKPDDPIFITPGELSTIKPISTKTNTPPGMALMFSKAGEYLVLDMAGGVSSTALVGRFTVFNEAVQEMAVALADLEMLANPEVILADIAQLSHHHVDNINRRQPLFKYQIAINTYQPDRENQIPLRDLQLSVQGDEIILESLSLGKRVIPRLSTAYNYVHNDLGVFRFLCELQYEGIRSAFSLDLEQMFPGLEMYPRVVYGKVILSLAKWNFGKEDILDLTQKPFSLGRLHEFRARHSLPAWITLGGGDQQLTFDLSDDQQAIFFLNTIALLGKMVLKEYLSPDGTVKIGKHAYSGQYIAFLHKTIPSYTPTYGSNALKLHPAERKFFPGSNWVYLKLYCTPSVADELLLDVVLPVIRHFKQHIDCWFFIRYADPDPHIRLRLRIAVAEIGHFLVMMEKQIKAGSHQELIRDYQSDSYQRELERYGPDFIEDVEALFASSSELVVRYLEAKRYQELKTEEHWFALLTTFLLAEKFWSEPKLMETFFASRSVALRSEYNNDKQVKRAFDIKYREISTPLHQLILDSSTLLPLGSALYAAKTNLLDLTKHIADRSHSLSHIERQQLIGDLIHMHLNRTFGSEQRQQETLVFHCLHKYMIYRRKSVINMEPNQSLTAPVR